MNFSVGFTLEDCEFCCKSHAISFLEDCLLLSDLICVQRASRKRPIFGDTRHKIGSTPNSINLDVFIFTLLSDFDTGRGFHFDSCGCIYFSSEELSSSMSVSLLCMRLGICRASFETLSLIGKSSSMKAGEVGFDS